MPTKKEMLLEENQEKKEKIEEHTSTLEALTVRELNDLEDVVISSLADNHILRYDSASGKWKNEAEGP